MRFCFLVLGLVLSVSVPVFACPRLEGRFECRANPPFELGIRNTVQAGSMFYTFSDPNIIQTVVPDGLLRQMVFATGKGTYTARCEGERLVMDVINPQGIASHDLYYIERAALVRVRTSPGQAPQSLSCRPIAGTWNLYRH